jgi:hypothetical protein
MKKTNKPAKSPAPATKPAAPAAKSSVAVKPTVPVKSAPAPKAAAAPAPRAKSAATKRPAANRPAAPAPSPAPISPAAAAPASAPTPAPAATTIHVHFDVGFGNRLVIRGDGAGLSWEQGFPLENLSATLWSITLGRPTRPVAFKVLINDELWCEGADYVVEPGATLAVTPTFANW